MDIETVKNSIQGNILQIRKLPEEEQKLMPEHLAALQIILDALEKATPKPPDRTVMEYANPDIKPYPYTYCPHCNATKWRYDHQDDRGTKYCRRCGQALLWEDEDDGGSD